MPRHLVLLLTVILLLFALPESASAYIGPGSGLTVVGAALAFIASIVFGVFGFIWYPVKRLIRALSKNAPGPDTVDK